VGWADKPCNAVAVEEIAGEVGAVEDEDVEEEIWSWKASRSFRRALDCLRAWLYSEFMSAEHRPKVPVVRARFRVVGQRVFTLKGVNVTKIFAHIFRERVD
jgi:hypothetical protein